MSRYLEIKSELDRLGVTPPFGPFQIQGVRFIEERKGRAILGLRLPNPITIMGLGTNKGKTMPSGIYHRTPEMLAAAKKCLDLGRTPEIRKKVRVILTKNASSKEWREKVSVATRLKMREPAIRQKHLKALAKNMKKFGLGFKGGNGQTPLKIMDDFYAMLKPAGFQREYGIKTAGHNTGVKIGAFIRIDFANPKTKVAIELDGPCHHNLKRQAHDEARDTVLRAFGWKIIRIKY